MRKFFIGISLLNFLTLMTFLTFFFAQKPRLAYVNSGTLLEGYRGMQDARKQYEARLSVWKTNVDTLETELQSRVNMYEKNKNNMSRKELDLIKKSIEDENAKLLNYKKAINTQAGQEESKMTEQVVEQVNRFLKKYGRENGFDIIMAATEYGNIVYANDGLNVTQDVLSGLNQEYKGLQ